MARLTRAEIQSQLLAGKGLTWKDQNQKALSVTLDTPSKRRLFEYLLSSPVRETTDLPTLFVQGLAASYAATHDPNSTTPVGSSTKLLSGPWKLKSVQAEGFGGLNIWGGSEFRFDLDGDSFLIDGPNGSGKSSLAGSIIWALSSERPRDHADEKAHVPKPVYAKDDSVIGTWPPLACYPKSSSDVKQVPKAKVVLTFQNPANATAKIETSLTGEVLTSNVDASLDIPNVLMEAGLLMPARMATLRLNQGHNRLTDAVQALTGLDDLAAIGMLAEGLTHASREYRSFKKKELATAQTQFTASVTEARTALAPVNFVVPNFETKDTKDDKGPMAQFVAGIIAKSGELTQVISTDLAPGLKLDTLSVQNDVLQAIGSIRKDLVNGLGGLATWNNLSGLALGSTPESESAVLGAVHAAREKAAAALALFEQSEKDSRFQLKAVAAHWHANHATGDLENCPLCEHDIRDKTDLSAQINSLKSAGAAATRTLGDNINAIRVELDNSLPAAFRKIGSEMLALEPLTGLIDDLKAAFITKGPCATMLTKLGALISHALTAPPSLGLAVDGPSPISSPHLSSLEERFAIVERATRLCAWFRENSPAWSKWWGALVGEEATPASNADGEGSAGDASPETLFAHLARLSLALAQAAPYRNAGAALRAAWKAGLVATPIEDELAVREKIVADLLPLKLLSSLTASVARDAIDGLSVRIGNLLKKIHFSEELQYHDARLEKKSGLSVRGTIGPDLQIDATLIANTSWLRAVLWAFIFSLREEAIDQLQSDPFPVFIFDDPQMTFDAQHRHRWAQYIGSLQSGGSRAQVILLTHDEIFLDLIHQSGVTGRQAMIAPAGKELGYLGIFEGASLDRKWSETQKSGTPVAARSYMKDVREYVEGMLRLMLRTEDANVQSAGAGFVLGQCREQLAQLNQKGIEPWNKPPFARLVTALDKNLAVIKHIEMATHASGAHLGMNEANDVECHWRKKLSGTLSQCFRLARLHYSLHGGLKALHAAPPTSTLPEGYKTKVAGIPLTILGRAAALSNGRSADGLISVEEYDAVNHTKVKLAQHLAYRLLARTLEPVARVGDILLVKEAGEPTQKSLVVALSDDQILARRFEIAENHTDVAVLTAQALNPRQIAQPVIGHKSVFVLHKIVGVLYDPGASLTKDEDEICACAGEASLNAYTSNALGLVEVVGDSAEPLALNGQYIVVGSPIVPAQAIGQLTDRPIIAEDTDDQRYFKRLRVPSADQIVLESMDSGGDHGPVVLSMPGKGPKSVTRIWPVLGILFELP